jgi:hypothetical protein
VIKKLYSEQLLKASGGSKVSFLIPYFDVNLIKGPDKGSAGSKKRKDNLNPFTAAMGSVKGKKAAAYAKYLLRGFLEAFVAGWKSKKLGDLSHKWDWDGADFIKQYNANLLRQLKRVKDLKAALVTLEMKTKGLTGEAGMSKLTSDEQQAYKEYTTELTNIASDWDFKGGDVTNPKDNW